jgi:acyl carrier protein
LKGKKLISDIISKIEAVMVDIFDVDDLKIQSQTNAADVEEWDSLSHIRLIVGLERLFKIRFSNSELESLHNVGDLAALIEQKLEA